MKIVLPNPPRRILLIKPSAIGDVVHTLPVWNLLRSHWPDAEISWLVTPACAGLLEGLRGLNVIRFERGRLANAWRSKSAARELLGLGKWLRDLRFDLVIDLQGLFRSGWMTWQTKAPVRIGFANAREFAWAFYTHRVPIDTAEQHATDRYLKVLAALGAPTSPIEYPLAVDEHDREHVARLLSAGAKYAVLLPGTNWATKRWPVEKFARLVAPLKRRLGLEVVVAGGPEVQELAVQIPEARNLVGQTNLRQLVALLDRADLVVANDSGPMHIAAALGRPLVALYGPTNPVRTGPYRRDDSVLRLDIPCSPCYSRRCTHQSCLQWLDIEPVLDLAQKQMKRMGASLS
ncbi:MAG TPA: lipopolysaccharide heptosyltransferase II [Tepidisphaeraceae bacterium]|nr:lipopolysaccharide heptosyltransferase II [Tepidisphaeraceae bacterium]